MWIGVTGIVIRRLQCYVVTLSMTYRINYVGAGFFGEIITKLIHKVRWKNVAILYGPQYWTPTATRSRASFLVYLFLFLAVYAGDNGKASHSSGMDLSYGMI